MTAAASEQHGQPVPHRAAADHGPIGREDGTTPGVRGPRALLLPLGIGLGGLALALGVQLVFDPFRTDVPLCIVYHLTRLHCPGCGATRAVHALLDGDPLLALRNNAPVVLALPVLALGLLAWAVRRVQGRTLAWRPPMPLLLSALALLALYTVARNLPLFWFLAPTSLVGA